MFIILDSFNNVVGERDGVETESVKIASWWREIRKLLLADALFYAELIIYYASVGHGKELEDAWWIAPYMRSLLIGLVDEYPELIDLSDEDFEADWNYLPEAF